MEEDRVNHFFLHIHEQHLINPTTNDALDELFSCIHCDMPFGTQTQCTVHEKSCRILVSTDESIAEQSYSGNHDARRSEILESDSNVSDESSKKGVNDGDESLIIRTDSDTDSGSDITDRDEKQNHETSYGGHYKIVESRLILPEDLSPDSDGQMPTFQVQRRPLGRPRKQLSSESSCTSSDEDAVPSFRHRRGQVKEIPTSGKQRTCRSHSSNVSENSENEENSETNNTERNAKARCTKSARLAKRRKYVGQISSDLPKKKSKQFQGKCFVSVRRVNLEEHPISNITKINYLTPRVCKCFPCLETLVDHRMYVDHMQMEHPSVSYCNGCSHIIDSDLEHECQSQTQEILQAPCKQEYVSDSPTYIPSVDPNVYLVDDELNIEVVNSGTLTLGKLWGTLATDLSNVPQDEVDGDTSNLIEMVPVLPVEHNLCSHGDPVDLDISNLCKSETVLTDIPIVEHDISSNQNPIDIATSNSCKMETLTVDLPVQSDVDPVVANSCNICGKTFSTAVALKTHNLTLHCSVYKSWAPFVCKICPAMFALKSSLSKHSTVIHGNDDNGQFQCLKCQEKYDSLSNVHCHLIQNHNIDWGETSKYFQAIKESESEEETLLEEQVQTDTKSQSGEVSQSESEEESQSDSETEQAVQTDEDSKSDDNLQNFRTIIDDSISDNNSICDATQKIQIRKIAIRKSQTQFVCKICKIKLSSKYNLGRHIEKVHKNSSDRCDICNTPFSTARSLVLHMNTMHWDIPFDGSDQCDICKKFMSKLSLPYHLKTVHPDHVKTISNKVIESRIIIDAIVKRPKDETHCNDKQSSSSDSDSNVSATSSKISSPQDCNILSDNSTDESKCFDLVEQIEPEQNHQCCICELELKSEKEQQRHEATVHANDVYKCYLCQVPFAFIRSLTAHMGRVHPEHNLVCVTCDNCDKTIPLPLLESHNTSFHTEIPTAPIAGSTGIPQCDDILSEVELIPSLDSMVFVCDASGAETSDIPSSLISVESNAEKYDTSDAKCNSSDRNVDASNESDRPEETVTNYVECLICHVTVSDKLKLKRHMDTVHAKGTHLCSVCTVPFSQMKTLKTHIKTMHPDMIIPKPTIKLPNVKNSLIKTANMVPKKIPERSVRWNARNSSQRESEDEDAILDRKNKTSYRCLQCSKRYRNKSSLRSHLRYNHKLDPELGADITAEIDKERRCPTCNISLDPRSYDHHMSKCRQKIATEIVSQPDIQTPENQATDKQTPNKQISEKIFPGPLSEIQIQDVYSSTCHFCKTTLSNLKALKAHNNQVHGFFDPGKAMHACNLCAARFVLAGQLSKHKRAIHGVSDNQSFECVICNMFCPTEKKARRHVQQTHGVRYQKVSETYRVLDKITMGECEYCKKQLSSNNISRHMKLVHAIGLRFCNFDTFVVLAYLC